MNRRRFLSLLALLPASLLARRLPVAADEGEPEYAVDMSWLDDELVPMLRPEACTFTSDRTWLGKEGDIPLDPPIQVRAGDTIWYGATPDSSVWLERDDEWTKIR